MELRNGLSAIVIAGMALASSTSQSQVTEAWFRNYNYQGGLDVAVDVATDVYGSVYVTGYGTNTAGNLDIVTLKYGRDGGDPIWEKFYDGPAGGDDKPVRIHVDALGNVFVLGTSAGSGTSRDFVIIKYDTNGNFTWPESGSFGQWEFHDHAIRTTDTRDETASDLFVDAAGNVYVIGTVVVSGTNTDAKVIVFDQDQDDPSAVTLRPGRPDFLDGNGGQAHDADEGVAIGVDSAGRVVAAAELHDVVVGNLVVHWGTQQWMPDGTRTWHQKFPNNGNAKANKPYDLAIDSDDNVYVCGSASEEGLGGADLDMAAVSYTSTGVERWRRFLRRDSAGAPLNDEDAALAIDLEFDAACEAKRVFITGYVDQDRDIGTDQKDYATVALDAGTGEPVLDVWPKRFDRDGFDDRSLSIAVRGKGNSYITGWSEASSANPDYLTIAYGVSQSSTWIDRWLAIKAGNGEEIRKAVTVHGAGVALVTGQYATSPTQIDYGTLLYKPEVASAAPDTVTVTAGTGSGNVAAFAALDTNRFSVAPDTSALAPSQIVLEGSVPVGATELAFRLAAFVQELNILQQIEFFNWSANQYEQVDIERVAAQTEEERITKMITIASACDPARYISSTGRVKVRVTHRNFTSLMPNPVIFDLGVWIYVD